MLLPTLTRISTSPEGTPIVSMRVPNSTCPYSRCQCLTKRTSPRPGLFPTPTPPIKNLQVSRPSDGRSERSLPINKGDGPRVGGCGSGLSGGVGGKGLRATTGDGGDRDSLDASGTTMAGSVGTDRVQSLHEKVPVVESTRLAPQVMARQGVNSRCVFQVIVRTSTLVHRRRGKTETVKFRLFHEFLYKRRRLTPKRAMRFLYLRFVPHPF